MDEDELRHVISILKLLALGAHKVCRALHVSSFAYDSLSHLFIKFSSCLLFSPFGSTWVGGRRWRFSVPTYPLFRATFTSPDKGPYMSSRVFIFSPGPTVYPRECIDEGTKRCRHTTHYRFLFRLLPYLSGRLVLPSVRTTVHPSIRDPLFPFFFRTFLLFASFRILMPHLMGDLLFSRARGSRFCHCNDCGNSALVAAAAAVRRPWTWAREGVTDGACVITLLLLLLLLFQPFGLSIGLLVFSCQMWNFRTGATSCNAPFATAIHGDTPSTVVVPCHSSCRTMAAAVLAIRRPRSRPQTCSLGFVSPPPCHFTTPLTCGSFWWIPDDEMASCPSAPQLPRRERKKMTRFDHACPWRPKPRIPLFFFLLFFFWKAQVSVLYLTHNFFFLVLALRALRSILCAVLPGSTLCRTISSDAMRCPPHMPNTHRFRRSHSQRLLYLPS